MCGCCYLWNHERWLACNEVIWDKGSKFLNTQIATHGGWDNMDCDWHFQMHLHIKIYVFRFQFRRSVFPRSIKNESPLFKGIAKTIIWANAGMLSVGPLGTYSSEISIEIYIISFTKTHLKMSLENWRIFCVGLNVFSQIMFVSANAVCWLYLIMN